MEPAGRTALVTGGAHRVGRAFALALARAGADVVVNYNSSAGEAQTTVADIEALGRRAVAVQGDVASTSAREQLMQTCDRAFGRLDILVNSASLFERSPVADITEDAWDRVLDVNLKAPFFLSQVAA